MSFRKLIASKLKAHFRKVYRTRTETIIRLTITALCISGIIALCVDGHYKKQRARERAASVQTYRETLRSQRLEKPVPRDITSPTPSEDVVLPETEILTPSAAPIIAPVGVPEVTVSEPPQIKETPLSVSTLEASSNAVTPSPPQTKTTAPKPPVVQEETYEVQAVRISDIRIGDRLPGVNPEGSDEYDEALIADEELCVYTFRVPKPDDSYCTARLLRPADWLEEQPTRIRDVHDGHIIDEDGDVEEFTRLLSLSARETVPEVWIDLEELGCVGWSELLRIEPFQYRSGEGNLVTGTFEHVAQEMLALLVEGQEQPINCTPNHPFWSEDRQEFVPAVELVRGEHVLIFSGEQRRVLQTLPRPGPEFVYNLEVFGEHVYLVTEDGILVHNNCLGTSRPHVRKAVKQKVLDIHNLNLGPGEDILTSLKGKHLGHKFGFEYWRLKRWAKEHNLSREKWRDLNNRFELYQVEDPIRNMRRIDEDKSAYSAKNMTDKLNDLLDPEYVNWLITNE